VIGDIGKISFDKAANNEQLQTLLEKGIREVQTLIMELLQAVNQPNGGTPLTTNSFEKLSSLHKGDQSSLPHSCQIWILTQNNGSPWQSLKDVLNAIGTHLKTYRRTLSPEKRATFGLPLNMKLPDKAVAKALRDSRRASPLLLRITKLSTGRYVGVAVLFKTAAPAIMDAYGTRILVPVPDYKLHYLQEDWKYTEIKEIHFFEILNDTFQRCETCSFHTCILDSLWEKPMNKPISTKTHGILDYLTVPTLLVLPRMLGVSKKVSTLLTGTAFGLLVYSMLTRYELGLFKLLHIPNEPAIDMLSGTMLAAAHSCC